MLKDIKTAIEKIRAAQPLVLNLTNMVTMDFMANALLALGAAPLMSVADEEIIDLLKISFAVNINIGTLDKAFIARAMMAAELAQGKIPVVFDPVGAGASRLRTTTARNIAACADIVRGNGSEIMALGELGSGGVDKKSMGVESTIAVMDAKATAMMVATQDKKIIIVSGKEDIITNGMEVFSCGFGTPLMKSVTGMGCVLTAVVAAFAAVEKDYLRAAVLATNFFALSGQVVARDEKNPASFKTKFIDGLHAPNWQAMEKIIDAL